MSSLSQVCVNHAAHSITCGVLAEQHELRVQGGNSASGTTVIDFGVKVPGGLEAGRLLAEICTGGAAEVSLHPADRALGNWPLVKIQTDAAIAACMAAQYAGWPVQYEKFFAMGSGPMRTKRGREALLEKLQLHDEADVAVGVLECDRLPTDEICLAIAKECNVHPEQLTLCVAPTRSLAGVFQVVARSVETCLHKLFALDFDLRQVVSASGTAPLAPPALDFAEGIGRTNDAILYGGQVALWLDAPDEEIERVASQLPSQASKDWGQPFADLFRSYNMDFYQVDPHLFSPAEVAISNLRTGRSWQVGSLRPDVLQRSFGTVAK